MIKFVITIVAITIVAIILVQRFSNNNISVAGYRIFTVATGSMIPVYEVGDILIAKEIRPEEIKVDDDLVYKGKEGTFKDKVVTHRVISINEENGKYKIITKGIANTEQDPEITYEQVYGKVIYQVKSLSFISKMISNIYVFYFLIFIPIGIIIFKQIKNIVSSYEEDDDDDEDEESKEKKKADDKEEDE